MADQDTPLHQVALRFSHHDDIAHVDDPVHKDLSAIAHCRDSLFFSCDETAGVDRLTRCDNGWGHHTHYFLGDCLPLPGKDDDEMDIEGLATDGDWLWIAGSHALTRDKPEQDDDAEAALAALKDIDREPNRFFIGRVPLVRGDGGMEPRPRDGKRRAVAVKPKKTQARLVKWLADDEHLGPFLDIPCKENGLDIEGIAAQGLTVWLGLRGPVLRGFAVILELRFKITGSGHLKARRIEGKRRYRKHLLETRGLGIRDLNRDGNDLLVLTGTPMAGDGPARVLRWRDAVHADRPQFLRQAALEPVLELPYRGAIDHPEGLAPVGDGWMVVYDSPSGDRLGPEDGRILADIFKLRRG